ncbi:MAG: restriction endonuclease subunit S [Marinobacter adhaerens]
MSARELITEHLDLWTRAVTKKSSSGRGNNGKVELTGVKKLRELILELAVRGKLVSQLTPNQSSSDLFNVMEKEKAKLVASKRIKKPKAVSSVSQENCPFDIPENWSWHSLGALGYTQTGSTPAKSKSELFGSDIPFLKPGDISESGEICYDNEGLSEAGKEALGKWAEKDSILMVCIGTIGKCGRIQQQCTFNQQINSITPFVPETSRFLLLCLQSPYFQDAAWEKSSSTTISILNKGKWESIPVPLPPMEEQHRIVQKVDELMALCDRLEQQTSDQLEAHETLVNTLLGTLSQCENAAELADNWARLATHFDTLFTTEQSIDKLKQVILKLAVTGRLVEQNPQDEPASTLLGNFNVQDEQLAYKSKGNKHRKVTSFSGVDFTPNLPKSWCNTKVGALFELQNGYAFKSGWFENKGIRLVRNVNVAHGIINWKDSVSLPEDMAKEFERFLLAEGDLIISLDRPLINTGLKYAVIRERDTPCLLLQRVARFRAFENLVDTRYLEHWLNSSMFTDAIDPGRSNGVPHISAKQIEALSFPLPPATEQTRIVQKVDELIALCDQLKERLNQASETRCQLAETIVEEAIQ